MSNIIFDRFALVECVGNDALSLLQGQTSADVNQLQIGEACFFCLCNVKGRMVANGLIVHSEDKSYHLVVLASLADSVLSTLARYAPFYKVSLTASRSRLALVDALHNEGTTHSIALDWPEAMRFSLVDNQQNSSSEEEQQSWFAKMMIQGVVFLGAEDSEKYLPSDLACDGFAVSFTKGCYTGQEIIARVHYRGKPKKRFYVARIETIENMPEDTELRDAEGNSCGCIVRCLVDADSSTIAACIDPQQIAHARIDQLLPNWQLIANASESNKDN